MSVPQFLRPGRDAVLWVPSSEANVSVTEGNGFPRTRRPGWKAWAGCVSVLLVLTLIGVGWAALVVWAFRWAT